MYKEFNGREWSSEDAYLKFKRNSNRNLNYSLALESYADYSGNNEVYKDIAFTKLKEFRKNKQVMSENELLQVSEELIVLFDGLVERIGKENFTIYEDGNVNFNWPKKKKEWL